MLRGDDESDSLTAPEVLLVLLLYRSIRISTVLVNRSSHSDIIYRCINIFNYVRVIGNKVYL